MGWVMWPATASESRTVNKTTQISTREDLGLHVGGGLIGGFNPGCWT